MIEVKGADQLAALAKQLKAAGDKGLQKELYAGINRAAKPVVQEIRKSANGGKIPRRGGLAAAVGKSSIRTQRRVSSTRTAGVRIVATNKFSLYHLNQGIVRHPVFGKGQVVQRIQPGFWSDPTEAVAEDVRREIVKVLESVAGKLSGGRRA